MILEKKMRIQDVAFVLGVSRQSISKWLAKYKFEGVAGLIPKKSGPKKGKAWNKTEQWIEEKIVDIAEENPFKGPDFLSDLLLEKEGIKKDQSTIYRILKRRRIRYGENYSHKRRKKKAYCLDNPGREIQLDVNFPFGYQRKEVVYDAIDDCSRFVYAKVKDNHSQSSSIEFVKELIEKVPFSIEAIRTDCGREFSREFTEFLKEQGIEHKKNPPYTPQHNGKIERYHGTFKNSESIYWSCEASSEELNYRLSL